jgi:hypothetical protein
MGFLFLFVGVLIAISAYRGTQAQLWQLVIGDVTGTGSFIWWIVAIAIIGGLGYIKPIRVVMEPLLVLVLVALFLSNSGVFAKLNQEIKSGDASAQAAPKDATQVTGLEIGSGQQQSSGGGLFGGLLSSSPLAGLTGGGSSGGSSDTLGQVASVAEVAAMFA